MRGKTAKRLRKVAYGHKPSTEPREYFMAPDLPGGKGRRPIPRGFCIADNQRRTYQAVKEAFKAGVFRL